MKKNIQWATATLLCTTATVLTTLAIKSAQAQDVVRPQIDPKIIKPQIDPKIIKLPIDPKINPDIFKVRVKGFADLHTHPAAHLAFGAKDAGSGRLIAGRPGMSISGSTLAEDLKDCGTEHFWDDADIVRSSTRTLVRDGFDEGSPHGRGGWPEFKDWPNARSVTHQQMHTTWIHRAYQGGLRLMVASLSDNQTIAMVWNRHMGASRPTFNPNSDFEIAKTEAQFMEDWARANSAWAQIVTSPAEARDAIGKGKLAIVLSTEMDMLTTDQILTLVRDHKVRMVMPIHFANNQFGGSAVYRDAFNTNNHFLNSSFFQVVSDPQIGFRLGKAEYLRYVSGPETSGVEEGIAAFFSGGITATLGIGAVKPTVDTSIVYPMTGGGHRNSKAFNTGEFKRLLREGLIIDIAHMSQMSQEAALGATKSGNWEYPVLNSHTGFRNAPGGDERAIRESDADAMARRGGVVGIGTVGDNQTAAILDGHGLNGGDLARVTGSSRLWLQPRVRVSDVGRTFRYVRITINSTKRDHEEAYAVIDAGSGRQEFDLVPERRGLKGMFTKTFPLTRPLTLSDIGQVGLRHVTGSYFQDGAFRTEDNWSVKSLKIELLPDPVTAWAKEAASMLAVMGDRGICLGTDFNGLEKQMPGLPTISITYPVTITSRFAPAMRLADGSVPPALNKHVTGSRTFDFTNDGLAHFGMLPDFLQAVSQTPDGERVVSKLFDGAEDVIRLWEKAQVAKISVP
jgi:microsomal dipeptidase-like Zn-dependent dipeptidase